MITFYHDVAILLISFLVSLIYFYFDKDMSKEIFWYAFIASFLALFLAFFLGMALAFIMTSFPFLLPFFDPKMEKDFDQWLPFRIGYFFSCIIIITYFLKKKYQRKSYKASFFYGLMALAMSPVPIIIGGMVLYIVIMFIYVSSS